MTASAISTRQNHRKIGCRDQLIASIGIGIVYHSSNMLVLNFYRRLNDHD
jgi:hypothetical protein